MSRMLASGAPDWRVSWSRLTCTGRKEFDGGVCGKNVGQVLSTIAHGLDVMLTERGQYLLDVSRGAEMISGDDGTAKILLGGVETTGLRFRGAWRCLCSCVAFHHLALDQVGSRIWFSSLSSMTRPVAAADHDGDSTNGAVGASLSSDLVYFSVDEKRSGLARRLGNTWTMRAVHG